VLVAEKSVRRGGCGQQVAVVACLLWFGVAPVLSTLLVHRVVAGIGITWAVEVLVILVAIVALIIPFFGLALLAGRRAEGGSVAGMTTGLAIASGYVVLDAATGMVFPQQDVLTPLPARYASAAVHFMVLVVYAAFAAWLAPRLTGISWRPMRNWLGLARFRWTTFLVALAAAAVVTLPWPLTGALGDSLASLALGVRLLLDVIPQLLIFWGVVFYLLTSSFVRTSTAAMATILIYVLSVVGGFLPQADWAVLSSSLFLLPMALLLTEMRARGRGIFPLLPLALCYRVVPSLFVDPRDVIAQGIPEIQHIISYLVMGLAALVLGVTLFMGRRASATRHRQGDRSRRRTVIVLTAAAAWALWGGAYLFGGQPGFFNDGFLIILEEQAEPTPARAIAERETRLTYVYETLVETAERTQRPFRAELDDLGVSYRPYYIVNMIRVDGHRWLMGRFEDRSEVAQVILNPNVRMYPRRIPMPYARGGESTEGVQENLAAIHADVAWELGIEGEGIVVGGQDSGYDWDHPALKSHYRGWDGEQADHNYNWHDAWDDTYVPFDDGVHGTHTMGTVLGDDGAGNRTGVAPNAEWMGCRNMRRGIGNPGSYAECMEFLLAPYPLGGDPFADGDVSLAPHVTNNSWGCPRIEGCFPETLRPGVVALRAAGIMMVVSAGNEGPACSTATAPPANYDASLSVGATSNAGDVVGFSSRGPVDGLVKPDITAPGQLVRSSVPGGGYAYAGGTSMAGPHVAGTVALVWSADTDLIADVDATEALLCATAVSRPVDRLCIRDSAPQGPLAPLMPPPACACGSVTGVPNNVYGCGVVDSGAAVRRALEKQE
ncbi:MAG: S8 family serine peptidase, partial [Anaerolineae bacterium]